MSTPIVHNILDVYSQSRIVEEIKTICKDDEFSLLVNNTSPSHHYLMASLAYANDQTVVFVAPNVYKATQAYENLCHLIGFEHVCFYVVEEMMATEFMAVSNEFKNERMHTLQSIIKGNKKIIVTHPNALLKPMLPKEVYIQNIMNFSRNQTIRIDEVSSKLVKMGYHRKPITSVIGEFSVRGSIIDIFPINEDKPLRIDLFDEDIDVIKAYDPETQKSLIDVDEFSVFPLQELIYDNEQIIIERIKKDVSNPTLELMSDFDDILMHNNIERIHKYIPYMTSKVAQFLDFIDDKIVFFEEPKQIIEKYEQSFEELHQFLEGKPEYRNLKLCFMLEDNILHHPLAKKVLMTEFRQTIDHVKLTHMIDIKGYLPIDYQNDIRNFINDVKTRNKTFIIACSSLEKLTLIKSLLEDAKIKPSILESYQLIDAQGIYLILAKNAIGFGFIDGFEVISEGQIFKKMDLKQTKYRSAYQNTIPVYTKEDLTPGEYVVHYDYGIGQYLGIKTVALQNLKNDYIVLRFSNMELYIPVEKINLIEKYQGTENFTPRLTAIGSQEWEKKKQKIKEKLEDIAEELIQIQAVREEKHGVVYQEDDELQQLFESDFPHIETKDQLKTIEAIKTDMEKGWIVDRLVCGDVGYGKTEIAMRAAFKTVLGKKQVAYLAPTTILTRQHYYTFFERFEKFGIKVALLNRFVPERKQNEIIEQLKKGDIDIVIGTHRLLSEDIAYQDLGLLIVDEEQRFGVVHKEKIKQYKNTINVITLTATPIPRTLQMAIMGVRQLSLIETPPQNRYPVQTYVLEHSDAIVREAIYREISRQGQVFYLHNRISDLEVLYRRIRRLVPEAKVLVAHGQMERNDLENAIQSFIDKEYDVLLCTTIIETGIDIPNTNTLIVDMADRLGLAQMYQIRGRVGRSDRVSYAYFMYDKNKVLTGPSAKRLHAIKEFTTLGSGYRIAVRDLAIRGAGDILGREQSGFIEAVGLDMYMKLLAEAIESKKGIKPQETSKKSWQIEVSKHVSNQYVSDDELKIYIHKAINNIKTNQDKEGLIVEMTDRFGRINDEIKLYIDKQYMESLLVRTGVDDIKETPYQVHIIFSKDASMYADGTKLFECTYRLIDDARLLYKAKRIQITIPKRINDKSWMQKVINLLENLINHKVIKEQ